VWLVDYSPGYAIARRLHEFCEGFRVPASLTARMVDMELDVDSLMGLLLDSWPFGCFLKGYVCGPRLFYRAAYGLGSVQFKSMACCSSDTFSMLIK